MKFRSKITCLFLLISLIPLIFIGLVSYYIGQASLKQNIGTQFQFIAQETIADIDQQIYEIFQKTKRWADLEQMQEVKIGDLDGRIISFLFTTQKNDTSLINLEVISTQGEVVSASNPSLIGRQLQEANFFKKVLSTSSPYISDIKHLRSFNTWGIEIAFPIFAKYDPELVIGVLRVLYSAKDFSKTLTQSLSQIENTYQDIILLRNDGLMIAGTPLLQKYLFSKNLLKEKFLSAELANKQKEGFLIEYQLDSQKCLVGYSYSKGYKNFKGFQWSILVFQSTETIFTPITRLKNLTIIIGCIVAILIFIISFFTSQQLTRPIFDLAQMVENVAKGNLNTKVKHKSKDEIGMLAKSFNKMVYDLKRTTVSRDALMVEINERKKIEEKLAYLVFHDALTNLPNRALLLNRLGELIKRSKRFPDRKFAILFIDFNRFKNINDSLGHLIGDELLVQIGKRMMHYLRDVDTVARLGGDEFVIIADDIKEMKSVLKIVERVQETLNSPFEVSQQSLYLTASIGVVISHTNYSSPEDLLRDADNAMYRAKSLGKNYQIFDESMHQTAVKVLAQEMDLRQAVKNKDFLIYYQPIVDLKTKKITRVEALLRWTHPEKGIIPPSDFIPLAEETGLILPIGEWLLERVCLQTHIWEKMGHSIQIAINFSERQLQHRYIVEVVDKILKATNTPASKIEIEITENTAMQDIRATIEILKNFRNLGVNIAMDDFGIGYSSLNYLTLFPINVLKIDRDFVKHVLDDPTNALITETIIKLAHGLKLEVVAEGVETEEQLNFLEQHHCDQGQGYLFSCPLPEEEISKILGSEFKQFEKT